MKYIRSFLFVVICTSTQFLQSQTINDYLNTVTAAVPFLVQTPDAEIQALGGAGVAVLQDKNAIFHNASKLVFLKDEIGLSANFRQGDDYLNFNLFSASGYMKLKNKDAVSVGVRLHDPGKNLTITGSGTLPDTYFREFAVDAAYAKMLGEKFSLGATLKYVNSNFTTNLLSSGNSPSDAQSIAADISCFYKTDFETFKKQSSFTFGANISNLGNKIAYTSSIKKDYISANLALGCSYSFSIDSNNSILLTGEVNKLLVPSPDSIDANNNGTFDYTERKLVESWITSFYDAPRGFSEEMKEIIYSGGLAYCFKEMFSARGGYFFEYPEKGDRQYFSAGFGISIKSFDIDFAYIFPASNTQSPVESAMIVSLASTIN